MLGAREHDDVADLVAAQQLDEQRGFGGLGHRVEHLTDALGRGRLALDVERHRVMQHVLRQALHFRGHGGAEEQRLALLRQAREHAADIGQEAHVEHAVGLVDHQHVERVEARVVGGHVVEQSTGRGDDHVYAGAEGALLGSGTDAAEHRRAGDLGEARELHELFVDLRSQLARGRQHQGAGGAAGLVEQAVQHGK